MAASKAELPHNVKVALTKRKRSIAAERIQRQFRGLLANRASDYVHQLLLEDETVLWRLAAVCNRAEMRAATLVQWRWRARQGSAVLRIRHASKRVGLALLEHHASCEAKEAQQRVCAEQEAEEQRIRAEGEKSLAIVRLQAVMRRWAAQQHALRAAHAETMGLLRQQWGANRQVRAVGAYPGALNARDAWPKY